MDRRLIIGIILIVVALITSIGGRWLIKKANAKPIKITNSNTIRQPKFYLYVGIGGIIFFLALGFFFLFAPDRMIVDFEFGMRLFAFFLLLAICIPYSIIIFLQINWKIEIGKDEFSFTNTFRKKRTYKFDDVELKLLSRSTRFYHNDKYIVGISYLQENWDALENAIVAYQRTEKRKN